MKSFVSRSPQASRYYYLFQSRDKELYQKSARRFSSTLYHIKITRRCCLLPLTPLIESHIQFLSAPQRIFLILLICKMIMSIGNYTENALTASPPIKLPNAFKREEISSAQHFMHTEEKVRRARAISAALIVYWSRIMMVTRQEIYETQMI